MKVYHTIYPLLVNHHNNNNKYIFSAKILVKYNIQNIKLRWETLKITKRKGPLLRKKEEKNKIYI